MDKDINNNELNNNEINNNNNLNENTGINKDNNDNNTSDNINYTVIQDVEYTTNDDLKLNEVNASSWQEEEEK